MQAARSLDLVELATNLRHPIADHSAVRFDLGFTGTAKEAETASLTLQVSPASHEAASLIIEMRELHLQPTFCRRRTLSKDLQNQPCPVDHLGADLLFEVFLLDWRQRRIDDQQPDALLLCGLGNLLDLAFAEQCRGPNRSHAERPRGNNIDTDGLCEALGLLGTRLR